jgi:hypothetical protein
VNSGSLGSTGANGQLVEIAESTINIWRDVGAGRPRVARYPIFFELIAYLQLPGVELHRVLACAAAALAPAGELLMIGYARRSLTDGVGGPEIPLCFGCSTRSTAHPDPLLERPAL